MKLLLLVITGLFLTMQVHGQDQPQGLRLVASGFGSNPDHHLPSYTLKSDCDDSPCQKVTSVGRSLRGLTEEDTNNNEAGCTSFFLLCWIQTFMAFLVNSVLAFGRRGWR